MSRPEWIGDAGDRRAKPQIPELRVTDVKTDVVGLDFRNAIFVRIETDAGITGLAETVMKRRTRSVEKSIHEIASYLIGKDPTEIENHWEKMYRDSFWVGGPVHSTAISALDCALWDILGKSCGVPVYKLLGGPTRREVPVYCHCPSGASPQEFAEGIRKCAERGYHAIKTTLPLFYGDNGDNGSGTAYSGFSGRVDARWKETEFIDPSIFGRIREFFQAAREAGGRSMGLALDCHGRLGLKSAIRLCRVLEDLDLMFIEEPVPPENSSVLSIVQRETSIPIAAGERWATVHGVREFLEKQAVDILQCDLVNSGGITGLKKIAGFAEAYYVGMAPHNPNGPLATRMNLHFAASIPNFYILETVGSDSDREIFDNVTKGESDFQLENGCLKIPHGKAGFGFEFDPSTFSQYPYRNFQGTR